MMFKVKNSSILEIPHFSKDKWLLLWLIVINSVIGGFSRVDLRMRLAASTVQLPVSEHSQLSDYTVRLQLFKMISEKENSDPSSWKLLSVSVA